MQPPKLGCDKNKYNEDDNKYVDVGDDRDDAQDVPPRQLSSDRSKPGVRNRPLLRQLALLRHCQSSREASSIIPPSSLIGQLQLSMFTWS